MLWIIFAVVLTGYVYWKLKLPHKYWLSRNVKQGNPTFLVGDNLGTLLKTEAFAQMVINVYTRFPEERYSGMYQMLTPTLVMRDVDLIKQITVKDFDHFLDHRSFVPEGADELWSRNLFALKGEQWRDMRITLSPSFTSSKMKLMFNLISDCAENFVEHFAARGEKVVTVEMKDTFSRYANDVIATCAFGVKCDSLKERENDFFMMGRDATDFSTFYRTFVFFAYTLVPSVCKTLGLTLFSKPVAKFFKTLVKDTITTREKNNIVRPDMINLLMEARKGRNQHIEDAETEKEAGFATVEESDIGRKNVKVQKTEITDLDITAQALIFFFAGFETISILMGFVAYELAVNEDIQDRLIQEIDDAMEESKGKVTYEAVHKMKYLDMVVTETLRKWPPAIILDRVCVKPYTIAPTSPSELPVHLEVGDVLWFPVMGIHRDPKHYPEPEKFDPERFNDENRDKIHPYAFLPFGAGPRNCIGSRFALMEAKTVFVHILRKFRIVPVEKTDIPFKISKKNFNPHAANGNWLGFQKRT